jgi:hypothetical protein
VARLYWYRLSQHHFTVFILFLGDQSGNHYFSSGVVQKLCGENEVGRWSKNTFCVHIQDENVCAEVGMWLKKEQNYVHITIE